MTLKDCYTDLHGDYEDAVTRMVSESLLQRMLLKFPSDKTLEFLEDALAANDQQSAFRAAHTLKGICLNFSFTQLLASTQVLTDALRTCIPDNISTLLEQVKADHTMTRSAILAYQQSLNL